MPSSSPGRRRSVSHRQYVYRRRQRTCRAPAGAIVIGDGTEDFLVVKEGVGVGDRVVVDGVGHVRDGDKVD